MRYAQKLALSCGSMASMTKAAMASAARWGFASWRLRNESRSTFTTSTCRVKSEKSTCRRPRNSSFPPPFPRSVSASINTCHTAGDTTTCRGNCFSLTRVLWVAKTVDGRTLRNAAPADPGGEAAAARIRSPMRMRPSPTCSAHSIKTFSMVGESRNLSSRADRGCAFKPPSSGDADICFLSLRDRHLRWRDSPHLVVARGKTASLNLAPSAR